MADTDVGIAQGINIAALTIPRPLNARFITSAAAKPINISSTTVTIVKAIYSDADVLEKIPFYTDFFAIIEAGNTRPLSPNYAEVSDAIQRNVHMALTGEQSVEDALNALQGEVEALSK